MSFSISLLIVTDCGNYCFSYILNTSDVFGATTFYKDPRGFYEDFVKYLVSNSPDMFLKSRSKYVGKPIPWAFITPVWNEICSCVSYENNLKPFL